MAEQSLGRSTVSGLLWLLFQSFGARFVSIFSQLFLARLLMPEQFGVISIVYIITSIAGTLTDFGVQGVILQRNKSFKLWALPAFWTSLTLGILGFLVVLVGGPICARLYHSPEVSKLAAIFALSMPIAALSTVPTIKMRRDLNFRFPAIYGTIENLFTQIATIALAYGGFGALSFVLPLPIFALIKSVIFWIHSPTRITGIFRLFQFKYLIANGSSVFVSSLLIMLIAQADYATLGLFADHATVGFYYFAFRLAAQPVWTLAGNFSNVLFPALVQIKNDPVRQIAASMKAARLLSYVIMPVCFGQAMIAKPALTYFFGHKWDAAIPLAIILSIGLPFDAASWVGGCIMSARRQFKRQMIISMFTLPIFLIFVSLGAYYGQSAGTAVAVAVFYIFYGPIYSIFVFRSFGASTTDIISLYVNPPLISGAAMFGSWWIFSSLIPVGRELEQLVCMGLMGPIFYLTIMYVLEHRTLFEIFEKAGFSRLLRKSRQPGGQE